MKVYKVTMKNLFRMGKDFDDKEIFNNNKKKIVIPKYQREYNWKDEKVKDLLKDISEHEKFLGFLIFDETTEHYEIVDGQQRLTTCFLILLSLYNAYAQEPMQQSDLRQIIMPIDNSFIFENESVGRFAIENDSKFEISISDVQDKYLQKDSFNRVFNLVNLEVEKHKKNGSIKEFMRKFLGCEFFVLIKSLKDTVLSVEQFFLDVNEKAQPLAAEDIFKGYCFEKFSEGHHDSLKETWVKIKEISFEFKSKYGYKDTSDFLYMYLLAKTKNITTKLTCDGEHYLKKMSMDEVNLLLEEMIHYGNSIIKLSKDIVKHDYIFDNLCSDSINFKNSSDFVALRDMCSWILEGSKSTIQKSPFLYFIARQNKHKDEIDFEDFRSIITNMYVYAFLFTLERKKKGKNDLESDIISCLTKENMSVQELKTLSKKIRKDKVETFRLPLTTTQFPILSFIYSVIDMYKSNYNFIDKIYKFDNVKTGENLEHFVVPNKKKCTIKCTWIQNEPEIQIDKDVAKKYKNYTTNYIILNIKLNGDMENYDLIKKIKLITEHYKKDIPKHIDIYIKHIEELNNYRKLKDLCEKSDSLESIQYQYQMFLEEYFEDNNQTILVEKLEEAFKAAFLN